MNTLPKESLTPIEPLSQYFSILFADLAATLQEILRLAAMNIPSVNDKTPESQYIFLNFLRCLSLSLSFSCSFVSAKVVSVNLYIATSTELQTDVGEIIV